MTDRPLPVTDRPDPGDAPGPPAIVVVGATSRDLAPDDPRGWRLGGAVAYGSLTTARLGVATGAIVGVDDEAASASELGLLRAAGVEVHLVPLTSGPVFANIERPGGRLQVAHAASARVPVDALPPGWRRAGGWLLGPVAEELGPDWADVPRSEAIVAAGWQGLLRRLVAGRPVEHIPPSRHPILDRADLVGISRDDVDRNVELGALYALLRPGATLVLTQGDRGGLVADGNDPARLRLRHYPAMPSHRVVDPTGAGDVFLAALAAARIEPRLVGGRIGQGMDLLLAAAAASLVLEQPGLHGVPSRDAVRHRMAEGLARRVT